MFSSLYFCYNTTNRFCNIQSNNFKRPIVRAQAGVCRINILHVIFNSAIAESYTNISNNELFFNYSVTMMR